MDQSTEIWLPVVGYEGRYEVSDHGNVRSLVGLKPRPLKATVSPPGTTPRVTLRRDGKSSDATIPVLVATAFGTPVPPRRVYPAGWGAWAKGTRRKGNRCRRGHEMTAENTFQRCGVKKGAECRTCKRTKSAEQRRNQTPEQKLRADTLRHSRRFAKKSLSPIRFAPNLVTDRMAYFGYRCWMCKRDDVALTVDHVKPLAAGGLHLPSNMRPACRPCNSRKNRFWFGVHELHRFQNLP